MVLSERPPRGPQRRHTNTAPHPARPGAGDHSHPGRRQGTTAAAIDALAESSPDWSIVIQRDHAWEKGQPWISKFKSSDWTFPDNLVFGAPGQLLSQLASRSAGQRQFPEPHRHGLGPANPAHRRLRHPHRSGHHRVLRQRTHASPAVNRPLGSTAGLPPVNVLAPVHGLGDPRRAARPTGA